MATITTKKKKYLKTRLEMYIKNNFDILSYAVEEFGLISIFVIMNEPDYYLPDLHGDFHLLNEHWYTEKKN